MDAAQVLKATKALLKHVKSTTKPTNDLLSGGADEQVVFLTMTTKKFITDTRRLQPSRIVLPHPYTAPDATVCLFSKDPQRTYKDMVEAAGLQARVTRVVGIAKLKGKHKSFEARRALLHAHDLFVVDDRVARLLPPLLGKTFYGAKKNPIPISVPVAKEGGDAAAEAKALREELDKALRSTHVLLAPGTTTSVKVALVGQSAEAVQENVLAVAAQLVEKFVPGKWAGVRSMHVKTADSVALPIWQADAVFDPAVDKLATEEDVHRQQEGKAQKRKRVAGIEVLAVEEVKSGGEKKVKTAAASAGKQMGDKAKPATKSTKSIKA